MSRSFVAESCLLFLVAVVWGGATGLAHAQAPRVGAGETLVVAFEQTEPPASGTDTLFFAVSGVSSSDIERLDFRLYEGETLLGDVTRPRIAGTPTAFRASSSPWIENSAVIDFTSLAAGNFDGRIEVTPTFASESGFFRWTLFPRTVDATGDGSFIGVSRRDLTVTSQFVIPEPTAATLLVSAACAIAVRRHAT